MTKEVKTAELFDCTVEYLSPLFSACEYPWEMLPKIKEFILDEKLDLVALLQNLALLTAGTVDLDLLGADELVHEGLGKALDGLGQELIQTLSRIVFLNGDDAHDFSFWGNG